MQMQKTKSRKPMAEINVVPYIDVMLVLLVVFMVTAPLLTQGVKVDLPDAKSAPIDDKDEEPLIITIKSDGSYYLNMGDQQQAKPMADIADTVAKVLRQKPDRQVLVHGDADVNYGVVVSMMTALQGAGAASVGLVTDPPKEL